MTRLVSIVRLYRQHVSLNMKSDSERKKALREKTHLNAIQSQMNGKAGSLMLREKKDSRAEQRRGRGKSIKVEQTREHFYRSCTNIGRGWIQREGALIMTLDGCEKSLSHQRRA